MSDNVLPLPTGFGGGNTSPAVLTSTPGSGGQGGGGGDGPDNRLYRVEVDVDQLKKAADRIDAGVSDIRTILTDLRVDSTKALGELKASLATLEERSKHLPTRWEVAGILIAIFGAVGAIIAIASRFIE